VLLDSGLGLTKRMQTDIPAVSMIPVHFCPFPRADEKPGTTSASALREGVRFARTCSQRPAVPHYGGYSIQKNIV